MLHPLSLTLALLAFSVPAAGAQEIAATHGDIGHGQELERQWCETCHGDAASSAPKFAVLNHSGLSDAEIARRIRGHTPVKPGFNFTDREMYDFLAWLRTQTSPPPQNP
jgi:mono/diheme cytochrome c family protein